MNTSPRRFLFQLVGVIIAALVPVILTAFLSIPFTLGGHPGEPRPIGLSSASHMT
jgi:hypothetical protein